MLDGFRYLNAYYRRGLQLDTLSEKSVFNCDKLFWGLGQPTLPKANLPLVNTQSRT